MVELTRHWNSYLATSKIFMMEDHIEDPRDLYVLIFFTDLMVCAPIFKHHDIPTLWSRHPWTQLLKILKYCLLQDHCDSNNSVRCQGHWFGSRSLARFKVICMCGVRRRDHLTSLWITLGRVLPDLWPWSLIARLHWRFCTIPRSPELDGRRKNSKMDFVILIV